MKGDLLRIVVVVICVVVAVKIDARPWYISCADSSECGLDSCCVLGGGRFSLPHCAPLARKDELCRVYNQFSINTTVTYPDDEKVDLTNIFSIMCPCQHGLTCSNRSGLCENLPEEVMFNTL